MSGTLSFSQYTEAVVGLNHPTLVDVDNRALRQALAFSGLSPDATFYGFASGLIGNGSPRATIVGPEGLLYLQSDGANGSVLWIKQSATTSQGWALVASGMLVFNALDFGISQGTGAVPTTLATNVGVFIQAALDAANTAGGGLVQLPRGQYSTQDVGTLFYYSKVILAGQAAGGSGGAASTSIFNGTSAGPLLAPKTPSGVTRDFGIQDLTLSAFGNANNQGGVDCTQCSAFDITRILVAGTKLFGLQFVGGSVGGNSGFGNVSRCQFTSLDSAAAVFLSAGTANDQPDGISFTDNYVSSNSTWIKCASAAGHGPGSHNFKGNRFEGSLGSALAALSVDANGYGPNSYDGNRFENTGSGGLTVTIQGVGSQAHGAFDKNTWAPGSGGLTWTDNGPIQSPRTNEFLPSSIVLNDVGMAFSSGYATLTDAATVTVNAAAGNGFQLTATGGVGATRAIGSPTNLRKGQRLAFTFIQDGTGGRALTWHAIFKQSWSDAGNTASKRSSIAFIYDGTSLNQDGAQTPYV